MGRIAEQKAAIPETIPTEIAGRYSGGDRAIALLLMGSGCTAQRTSYPG